MPDPEPRSPRKPSPLEPLRPFTARRDSGLELRAAQPEPTEADFDHSSEAPLPHWAEGRVDTVAGRTLRVKSAPGLRDRLDLVRSRLVRRRERIRVAPGLYALGNPGTGTPVFVTANYKPSFDALRFALSHRDAWLLVLDTKGVNVWCAAGKGRFGDAELLRRLRASGLERIAPRADLVLPQLGATGVGAWKIAKATGRRVRVGPVRAADLGAWLDSGCVATAAMRRVRFGLRERAVLIPREIVARSGAFALALLPAIAFAWSAKPGIPPVAPGANLAALAARAFAWWAAPAGGLFMGLVAFPLALPVIPFRHFSAKGALLGAAWTAAWLAAARLPPLESISGALAATSVASYLAVNFTGSSTCTSQDAVKRELRIALPLQAAGAVLALLALAARMALALAGAAGGAP